MLCIRMCVCVRICVCVRVHMCMCCVPSVTVYLGNYRLWDFDRDENYLLELSSIGQIAQTGHVTFIDYNKIKGKSHSMTIRDYC